MTSNASRDHAERAYSDASARGLKIDISRGLPSASQLALSEALLTAPLLPPYVDEDGVDVRNYGGQQGLLAFRRLFAPVLGVSADRIIANGGSSLALMFECLAIACRRGTPDGPAWSSSSGATFLCPVPGYDRHFAMAAEHGIRLLAVPMTEDGPHMATVQSLVAEDPSIKGIWCVPKYSNPTGAVYGEAVVESLGAMRTAAPDFRIFWDDAYCLHPLGAEDPPTSNIHETCSRHGHPNRPLAFASTSKMTLPGAGVAMLASSEANIRWWLEAASLRQVGPDKVNQLRQLRFLRDLPSMRALMAAHAALLAPKFELVHKVFSARLAGRSSARWTRPRGGYFVSLNVSRGTARRTIALASAAGVQFTQPGSCFPNGEDPHDSHLRLAPSYADMDSLREALEVIAASILKAEFEAR